MVLTTKDEKSEERIVRRGDWGDADGADDVFLVVWSSRAVRKLYTPKARPCVPALLYLEGTELQRKSLYYFLKCLNLRTSS